MKRITICTLGAIGALTLTFGFTGCEEGAGKRGNPIDESKVVTPPQDDPSISLDSGKSK